MAANAWGMTGVILVFPLIFCGVMLHASWGYGVGRVRGVWFSWTWLILTVLFGVGVLACWITAVWLPVVGQ